MRLVFLAFFLASALHAQWELQDSHTTAGLRGIHALGGGFAWASGSEGTVLRTTDDGQTWQTCAVPPGAEKLDFRGVQAFDANTAVVMSSGKGELSRLYKTIDGCRSWKLVFTNPDKDGFWDAIKFPNQKIGFILGDPITRPFNYSKGHDKKFVGFALLYTEDGGQHFLYRTSLGNQADAATQGAFAASNSSLFVGWPAVWFGTGGKAGARVYLNVFLQHIGYQDNHVDLGAGEWRSVSWAASFAKGDTGGVFSLAFIRPEAIIRDALDQGTSSIFESVGVGVGGDYLKPDDSTDSAAYTVDGGQHWQPPQTPPHGYRSAVAYSPEHKAWITVGPNGTDVSTDDGRNWRALTPGKGDAPGADRDWNALSLPFVVGPKGRIGRLSPDAISAK